MSQILIARYVEAAPILPPELAASIVRLLEKPQKVLFSVTVWLP
ncbi:hypothetical protein [Sphingopyxis sp. YR583]|nr:hypothetical protein [Sphingopyxis sp. YR583]